jgi:hypothetical protein
MMSPGLSTQLDKLEVSLTLIYILSYSITTDVASSNLDQGEVYNIM